VSAAGVWRLMTAHLPLLWLLSLTVVCAVFVIWTPARRKRFRIRGVMFSIVGIAVLVAVSRLCVQISGHDAWLFGLVFLSVVWTGWLTSLDSILAPEQRRSPSQEQWCAIDARILACEPRGALRLIRDFTGADANFAQEVHLERYQTLRTERFRNIPFTDEDYWRCLYD
jgi:hypothetical protein